MPCSSRTSNSAARDEREWTAPMRRRARRKNGVGRESGACAFAARRKPRPAPRRGRARRPCAARSILERRVTTTERVPFGVSGPIQHVEPSTGRLQSSENINRLAARCACYRRARAARPAQHGARCPRDRSPRPWASAEPSRNGRRSTKSPACAVKVRARPPSFDARRRSARVRILFFFSGHEANAPTRRASFADKPSIASRPNPTCASRL